MEKEEVALIQKAQAGDQEAFASIYEKYYQSVFIKANSLCHHETDAEDMVQDTFYEVHRSLKDLRDCTHFYSWLMMITASKCHNMFRKKRYISTLNEEINIQDERIYMDPRKAMDNQEEQRILHDLVCELPFKYAEILQLVYFEHCKLIEVSQILQLPLGTVKTRVVRAREMLKKKVTQFEKQEQRTLHFHEDVLATSLTFPWVRQLMMKGTQAGQMVTSHVMMSTCICVLGITTAFGVPYLYHTYLENKQQDIQSPTISQQHFQEEETNEITPFPLMHYKEQVVDTNRKAYYYCLNFAKNETIMKQRTKQEFEDFLPVYEAFKQEHSPHYLSLQKQGWTQVFEAYAYQ